MRKTITVTNNKENDARSRERMTEYDVVRVLVTLLVVIGHSTYLSYVTPYGGLDYTAYAPAVPMLYKGFTLITNVIYTFHMPLFMALSGALFWHTMEKKKYSGLGSLILDKSKRLLIPFFVVGGVLCIPT